MFVDANAGELTTVDADVCICGGGPAGITLARSLAKRNIRVLLLEGGDEYLSDDSQDLYRGINSGIPYFALDETRLRLLGGSSNHWTGHCGALNALDFEALDYAPMRAWPIEKADLDPFVAETRDILDLPPMPPEPPTLHHRSEMFEPWVLEESAPTHFAFKYYDEMATSKTLTCVLNCNVVDIRLKESGRAVSHLLCASHANPQRRIRVQAAHFALCLGGIENPRLLLNCTSQKATGIGNERDLVGRYFCEHPHARIGSARLKTSIASHFVQPTRALLERYEALDFGLRVYTRDEQLPDNHLRPIERTSWRRQAACRLPFAEGLVAELTDDLIYCDAMLWVMVEQDLNPDSRVTLTDRRDKFGLRRPELHWALTERDWTSFEAAVFSYGEYLIENDLGRARLHPWVQDRDLDTKDFAGGHHHMCTTRMSAFPEHGVVDADCRVHGIDNLYIGGSSVFASGGHINPTFTIVQLALRLGKTIADAV